MFTDYPLVNVIIPCCNAGEYVKEAINSIVSQTYKNLEILIVDDASTDHSLSKIEAIKDDRIRILRLQENTKKIGAVNQAFELAKGDCIAFQDADDFSHPQRIEKQLQEFSKDKELGICFTGFQYFGAGTKKVENLALTDEALKTIYLKFMRNDSGLNMPACATALVKKDLILKTGGYHPFFIDRVGEDIYLMYQILRSAKGITVDEVLYNYRIHENSLTSAQMNGKNAKASYSWHLIRDLIFNLEEKSTNLLAADKEVLLNVELKCCQEKLAEAISEIAKTRKGYETSNTFKVGKAILASLKFLGNK